MGHSKGWILLEAILCNHPTESWSRWNKEERINISGWFDFSISNLYQFWGWIYHNLIVRDISFVCSEEGNTEFHSIYPQQSVRDTFDFCANSRVRSWMGIFSETTTTCVALSLVWNNHNSCFFMFSLASSCNWFILDQHSWPFFYCIVDREMISDSQTVIIWTTYVWLLQTCQLQCIQWEVCVWESAFLHTKDAGDWPAFCKRLCATTHTRLSRRQIGRCNYWKDIDNTLHYI